jgi:hypothetical protein
MEVSSVISNWAYIKLIQTITVGDSGARIWPWQISQLDFKLFDLYDL